MLYNELFCFKHILSFKMHYKCKSHWKKVTMELERFRFTACFVLWGFKEKCFECIFVIISQKYQIKLD